MLTVRSNIEKTRDKSAESVKLGMSIRDMETLRPISKVLPELDDEFASEVSEFDTLTEYKEDVKKKLAEKKKQEKREARWAELDKRDAEKAAAKEAKRLAKERKRKRQALEKEAERARKEAELLEKYKQEYREKKRKASR